MESKENEKPELCELKGCGAPEAATVTIKITSTQDSKNDRLVLRKKVCSAHTKLVLQIAAGEVARDKPLEWKV